MKIRTGPSFEKVKAAGAREFKVGGLVQHSLGALKVATGNFGEEGYS